MILLIWLFRELLAVLLVPPFVLFVRFLRAWVEVVFFGMQVHILLVVYHLFVLGLLTIWMNIATFYVREFGFGLCRQRIGQPIPLFQLQMWDLSLPLFLNRSRQMLGNLLLLCLVFTTTYLLRTASMQQPFSSATVTKDLGRVWHGKSPWIPGSEL